ncbi:MAG: tetraacyldisaccharide 4'-kinase [bacterium]|nr:tetraacyldisaccharide 4'-kinase [bacterium]
MPKPVTRLLSAPWGGLMALRRRLYHQGLLPAAEAGLPVVSVGNISLGGTGKSPLIRHLARSILQGAPHELAAHLPELPPPVAILSRGYGRRSRGWRLVSQGEGPLPGMDVDEAGDEPLMLARQVPTAWVAVCEDRRAGARRLRELGAGCLLLDDGFQHLALRRDRDLLLWDCAVDPAREAVLPFGRLRESPAAALDAHLLLLGRPSRPLVEERLAWFAELFRRAGRPLPPLFVMESSPGRLSHPESGVVVPAGGVGRHGIFCGIAAPERFLAQTVRLLGPPAWSRCLGDHHRWSEGDLAGLRRAVADHHLRHLVTTWKDAVRLPAGHGLPVLAADLDLRIRAGHDYLARHD